MQQVRGGQLVQPGGRLGGGYAGQRGGAGGRDVLADREAEQPEHPARRGGQRPVGQAERGPYRRLVVRVVVLAADGQGADPVGGAQPGDMPGDALPRPVDQVRGGDP